MNFQSPKGRRLNRYFDSVQVKGMWYVPEIDTWLDAEDKALREISFQNYAPCKTLRAFKRHLRKHPAIKGKATLRSVYVGHDVRE